MAASRRSAKSRPSQDFNSRRSSSSVSTGGGSSGIRGGFMPAIGLASKIPSAKLLVASDHGAKVIRWTSATGAGRPMLTSEPQASRRWALVSGRRNLLTRLS